MIIPTLVDPRMAPPGKHIISCFVQYAPYHLAEGTWDEQREAFGDTVVDTIAERAPNIRDLIVGRQVLTPLDIERTTGLTEGNIFQGELSLEQLFLNRPVPGWARYRTPVKDLWMCGSSVHPGGGIMGANGRIAALEVLKAPEVAAPDGAERPRRARADAAIEAWGAAGPEAEHDRARRRRRWDAIVVGGGHNGLVCGAYLARAGLRTLILERREAVGGAVATAELSPGARVPLLAHTVGRLRGSIARELGLARHGLRLVQPAARVTSLRPDASGHHALGRRPPDRGASWRRCPRRTPCAGSRSTPRSGRSRASCPASRCSRRPIRPRPRWATWSGAMRLGLHLRGLPEAHARALFKVLPQPVADFLEDRLAHDALRAMIALRGMRYSSLGPGAAGSTQVLLADAAGNDGGAAGETVYARGGAGCRRGGAGGGGPARRARRSGPARTWSPSGIGTAG